MKFFKCKLYSYQGFTKDLSINCTFLHGSDSELAVLNSIILSKTSTPDDSVYSEVAKVFVLAPNTVDVTDAMEATVTGRREIYR